MPSIEDILADLESDAETSDDTNGEDSAPALTENPTIKQIRDYAKAQEKKAKDLAKELKAYQTKVNEFETAQRESTVKGVFAELELPEKQAALYLKTHEGEITADSIKQFVTDYGLKDLSQETGGTTEDKSQGFTPGGTGGAQAPTGGKISRVDWLALVGTDPAKAQKLQSEGRVDMTDVAFGAR